MEQLESGNGRAFVIHFLFIWLLVSIPAGILIGRFIKFGSGE